MVPGMSRGGWGGVEWVIRWWEGWSGDKKKEKKNKTQFGELLYQDWKPLMRAVGMLLPMRTTVFIVLAGITGLAGISRFAPAQLAGTPPTSHLGQPANGPRRADPSWHALRNATVHVGPGVTIAHGTVVVRDGKVWAVLPGQAGPDGKMGTEDDVPASIPMGPRVWDLSGQHIYAGFIDAYVEVDTPLPDVSSAGQHWSPRVMPQRRATDGKGIEERDAESLRKLGFTAAAIAPKRGVLRGRGAVVSLASANPDLSQARPPVYQADVYQSVAFDLTEIPASGPNPEDRWPGYPNSQMGAIALIRQTLIDADWQNAARRAGSTIEASALDALPAANDRTERWVTPLLFTTSDELESLRAAKIGKEFDRKVMIVGCGTEFRRLDAIVADGLPIVLPINFPEAPDVSTFAKSESIELEEMMVWEQSPTNPRRLSAAGLKVALTTAKLEDKSKFSTNLSRAIRYGLDPENALAMVTTIPAELLGVSTTMGRVEEGMVANLVVSDKPLFVAEKSPAQKSPKTKKEKDGKPVDVKPGEVKPGEVKLAETKPGDAKLADAVAGVAPAGEKPVDGAVKADQLADEKSKEDKSKDDKSKDEKSKDGKKGKKGEKKEDDRPVIRDVWIDGLRHEIVPPSIKLAGAWTVTFEPPRAEVFTLEIDEKNAITVKIGEAYTTADKVGLAGNRLGFVYDTSEFDGNGTAVVNAIAEKNAAGEVTMYGEIVNPDSTRVRWTAKQPTADDLAKPDAKEDDKAALEDSFVGSWKAYELDGKPGPNLDLKAPTIAIAKDGAVTIKLGDKQSTGKGTYSKIDGQGPKNQGKARLEYRYDNAPFGSPGDWEDSVTIEDGVLVGVSKTSAGATHRFKAKRIDGEKPKRDRTLVDAMTGTYVMVSIDDVPADLTDAASTFITVNADKTVALKGLGMEMAPTDILIERDRIAYTVTFAGDTAKANKGLEGTVKVQGRRFNDFLIGSMVVPEGGTRSWKAVRVAQPGQEIIKDAYYDDLITLASMPETIRYPFGPYGVAAISPQKDLIINNATIWTSGPAGTLHNASLVVANGKIKSIVQGQGELKPSVSDKGFVVIDAAGKHVTAGIIDCHSHTGISRGVNESGQAVTAEVRIQDVTNPDAVDWYRQLAGGVTTVNNLHGSANVIGGQNCVNKVRWGVPHPDQMHMEGAKTGIKFALGENPKASNWGDRATTRYPQTRMGVEGLLRDRFTAAREYLNARKLNAANFHRDLELEALAEILEGKRLIHCHSYRQDEILMLCRLSEEFEFKIGTFQHGLEGYKVADAIKSSALGASIFSDWWAYKVEVQDAIPQAGPIMTEVGVPVSFNSDSDEMARRLNAEAAKAIRYGDLKPEEALKYVTLNPAIQLAIQDRVGSLEVGKDADFAIWSGPPMSVSSRCEATYVDGREYFSITQDKSHRERIAKERTRLIQKALGAFINEQLLKSKKEVKPGEPSEGVKPPKDLQDEFMGGEAMSWHYLDLYNRGINPMSNQPGVCGCGVLHQR